MPYKLVASGDNKYYVVSPHGNYLSKHPLTKETALRQKTAVRLTELRKENPHYAPGLQHANEEHVHKVKEEAQTGRLDAMGLPFVPAPRDAVHKHGIIKTSDIFAPLPLPTHHLR